MYVDWDTLPHTRAIFIALQPRLPDELFEKRIAAVEDCLTDVQAYCEEHDIDMPDTAICVDVDNQSVVITHENYKDTLRWYQILFRIQKEQGEFE